MNLKNLDHKDVWVRAGKTAIQAALGALILVPQPLTLAGVVGVLAGVVSAVWNYLLQATKNPVDTTPAPPVQ